MNPDVLRYIYLDESGNLGFKENSGKYFVVAALCVEEEKIINRCIKNARDGLSKKHKKIELKFSNSSDTVKRRVLKCIVRKDVSISYILLNKDWISPHLCNKPPIIHKYMIGELLSNMLYDVSITRTNVIIDKFLYGKYIGGFNSYINLKSPVKMKIEHVPSYGNNGIQAVDFVAGAIHKKYRDRDDFFYNLIEDRIDISLNSRKQIFKKKIIN